MWSSRDIGCKNREFELSLFAKRVILYPGEASGEPLENSKTRHFDWTSVSFFSVDISVFGGEKAKSIVTEPTYIIYESYSRAGHGWRESRYRYQGSKASGCGQLGRQAAGHLWRALRVAKSCRKRLPHCQGAAEAKAAALHPKRYQSSLSKLSTKGGRVRQGKEAQAIGLASQSDR